jgi:hypothetical protein
MPPFSPKILLIKKWGHFGKKERWCVSDCCLMPTQQFFSYIMARAS